MYVLLRVCSYTCISCSAVLPIYTQRASVIAISSRRICCWTRRRMLLNCATLAGMLYFLFFVCPLRDRVLPTPRSLRGSPVNASFPCKTDGYLWGSVQDFSLGARSNGQKLRPKAESEVVGSQVSEARGMQGIWHPTIYVEEYWYVYPPPRKI